MLTLKGFAHLYIGWEAHTDEPKVVSKAWFRELAPPYRNGKGIRIRFGHKALQFGTYRKNRDENPSALSQLGGHVVVVTPEQIGKWRGPGSDEPTVDPTGPTSWPEVAFNPGDSERYTLLDGGEIQLGVDE